MTSESYSTGFVVTVILVISIAILLISWMISKKMSTARIKNMSTTSVAVPMTKRTTGASASHPPVEDDYVDSDEYNISEGGVEARHSPDWEKDEFMQFLEDSHKGLDNVSGKANELTLPPDPWGEGLQIIENSRREIHDGSWKMNKNFS